MKRYLALAILAGASLAVQAQPTVSPQSKLILAEAATAIVLGPVVVPFAVVTGQRKELCDAIRMRPRSCFDDNSVGRDQCPCGNWLRAIPLVRDFITDRQGE